MISAVICKSLRWDWHLCNLPSVSVLFLLISISRYVLSLQVFASEGQNMTHTVSVSVTGLHSKLWLRARLWYAGTVDRFLSRVSYFSSETRSLTSKKLYAFLEKFSCFLQLYGRAYVSGARCMGLFLLWSFWCYRIYIPLYAQVCWLCCVLPVYATVRLSSVKVSQDHGFDPPCGSHQLPVFLKYSVRLKLLAQLVHRWECKTLCGLAQNSRSHDLLFDIWQCLTMTRNYRIREIWSPQIDIKSGLDFPI